MAAALLEIVHHQVQYDPFPPCPTKKAYDKISRHITNCALQYAKYVKPHTGKSATSADKAGKYIERPGEVCGEIRLVKGWFAIGQEVCNHPFDLYISDGYVKHKGEVVPSPETFKTGGAFARTAQLYRQLDHLSKMINKTIKHVDPQFFDAVTQFHQHATAKHASLAA